MAQVGSTRFFEASYSIIEWMLEERDLSEREEEVAREYHDLLCRTAEDIWGVEPPRLPEKNDDVPTRE